MEMYFRVYGSRCRGCSRGSSAYLHDVTRHKEEIKWGLSICGQQRAGRSEGERGEREREREGKGERKGGGDHIKLIFHMSFFSCQPPTTTTLFKSGLLLTGTCLDAQADSPASARDPPVPVSLLLGLLYLLYLNTSRVISLQSIACDVLKAAATQQHLQ